MSEKKRCKFCSRQIPLSSVFCPYCGNSIVKKQKVKKDSDTFSEKLTTGLQKSFKAIRKQVSIFLEKAEEKVEKSESISFVNKEKILNVLHQVQQKDPNESNKEEVRELSSWARKVEEAISGEKCIICLQKFDVKNKEKLGVILCPNCNYAGHPKHFEDWLKEKETCPLCRSELKRSNLVRGTLTYKGEELVFTSA
ncbi:MAG: RING finger domain-containing protein [Candidatus Heimdallarchaeaceae archaeon]